MTCTIGYVCVEEIGQCVADPCGLVRCSAGKRCVVEDHGEPTCVTPQNAAGEIPGGESNGNSRGMAGSSCHIGQEANSAIKGFWILLIFVVLFRKTKGSDQLNGATRRGNG
jgi:hypothetical protein